MICTALGEILFKKSVFFIHIFSQFKISVATLKKKRKALLKRLHKFGGRKFNKRHKKTESDRKYSENK